MTSDCPPLRMPWNGATGAIARCTSRSTACAHKSRFVPAWRWICGVKPKPKAVNKPSHHSIRPGLDKLGVFTTVSIFQQSRAGDKYHDLPYRAGVCYRGHTDAEE